MRRQPIDTLPLLPRYAFPRVELAEDQAGGMYRFEGSIAQKSDSLAGTLYPFSSSTPEEATDGEGTIEVAREIGGKLHEMLCCSTDVPLLQMIPGHPLDGLISYKALYVQGMRLGDIERLADIEQKRVATAAYMSKMLAEQLPEMFVVLQDVLPRSHHHDDQLYAARLLGFLHASYKVSNGATMFYDPVVEAADGRRGLLPLGFHAATGSVMVRQ